MLIIDKGRKLVEGEVKDLFDPAETMIELRTGDDEDAWQKLQQSVFRNNLQHKSRGYIAMKLVRDRVPELISALVAMNVGVTGLNTRHSLEDYFLSLTSGQQHVEVVKN